MYNEIETTEEESKSNETGVSLLQSFFDYDSGVPIPKPNIAPLIDDDILKDVGRVVVEGYDCDWDSMEEWREYVRAGRELVKQEDKGRANGPWDGSSNFKSPTITIAGIKHGDRATTELLRQVDIVKTTVVGKDEGGAKAKRAERVATYQNYQVNEEMSEWREEQGKLFSLLPTEGCLFKKTYFDSVEQRADSVIVRFPNFAVNQATTSTERMRRFSEIYDLPENDILSRQRQGIWLELKEDDEKESGLTTEGETSIENQIEEDKFNQFIEQQGFYDLDGDGYQEPYTFTVHKDSAQVMRITPRFEPENVVTKKDGQVIRIKPNTNITKYGFLRDPQGGFLDVGFYAVLGAMTASINSTTNLLVDSGVLQNYSASTGWLAKGFRKKMGKQRFRLGEFKETNLTAQDLKNGVMSLPVNQPSMVLFNLMQMMVSSAQEVSSSTDLKSALGANAPAATTLALIQEAQEFGGAIIVRQYLSMSSEFKKLFVINSKYSDQAHYQNIVDDQEADYEADFNLRDMNITPTANPELSSKMQRIQLAEVEVSKLEAIMMAGGDPRPVITNFLEMIGSTNVEEIFPEMDPMQRLQDLVSKNPELAEMLTQEQARTEMLMQAEQQAIEQQQQLEAMKGAQEIDKIASETRKNDAITKLTLEKAQTEDLNNDVITHKAVAEIDKLSLENEVLANERDRPAESGQTKT